MLPQIAAFLPADRGDGIKCSLTVQLLCSLFRLIQRLITEIQKISGSLQIIEQEEGQAVRFCIPECISVVRLSCQSLGADVASSDSSVIRLEKLEDAEADTLLVLRVPLISISQCSQISLHHFVLSARICSKLIFAAALCFRRTVCGIPVLLRHSCTAGCTRCAPPGRSFPAPPLPQTKAALSFSSWHVPVCTSPFSGDPGSRIHPLRRMDRLKLQTQKIHHPSLLPGHSTDFPLRSHGSRTRQAPESDISFPGNPAAAV